MDAREAGLHYSGSRRSLGFRGCRHRRRTTDACFGRRRKPGVVADLGRARGRYPVLATAGSIAFRVRKSGAAVWSLGATIMMLFAGFDGDRRALAGGLILLASVLVANYAFPHAAGYVLAAGFILGYAIPGMLFLAHPLRAEA